MSRVSLLLLLGFVVSKALRIAQINDLHVNLNYADEGFGYCKFPICLNLGNFFMDPPVQLLDTVLGDMKYNYHTSKTPIDAVLIGGDFVVHGLSNSDPDHKNWGAMKEVLAAAISSV